MLTFLLKDRCGLAYKSEKPESEVLARLKKKAKTNKLKGFHSKFRYKRFVISRGEADKLETDFYIEFPQRYSVDKRKKYISS